jgi:hypothetical protein
MGGTQLRNKAQAFLNRGKIDADELIKAQSDQIAELQAQMKILMEAQPPEVKRVRTVKE